MTAFREPGGFAFVPWLEAAFDEVLRELDALEDGAFLPSPDSLTTVADGYDETGWLYYDLFGGADAELHRAACPATARTCSRIPGLRNAGFSLLRPGTHLFPHCGELPGVLRCHLGLRVPLGDLGLRIGGATRVWRTGRCLIFDDTFEHDAWNRGAGDRVVLLVTFAAP